MNTYSTKTFSWSKAILLSVGVGLLVAGLSIFLQIGRLSAAAPAALALPPVAVDGLGTSFEKPGQPVRLTIPSIGVDADIESVGLSWRGNGEMGVPTNFTDVGWYNGGVLPGMPGNAVIDGHLDGKDVPRAVFYDLDRLQPGDVVEVMDEEGNTLTFRVVRSALYDYDAPTADIFTGDASQARLNLITCAGDWDTTAKLYDKRIVVFTELIARDTTPAG